MEHSTSINQNVSVGPRKDEASVRFMIDDAETPLPMFSYTISGAASSSEHQKRNSYLGEPAKKKSRARLPRESHTFCPPSTEIVLDATAKIIAQMARNDYSSVLSERKKEMSNQEAFSTDAPKIMDDAKGAKDTSLTKDPGTIKSERQAPKNTSTMTPMETMAMPSAYTTIDAIHVPKKMPLHKVSTTHFLPLHQEEPLAAPTPITAPTTATNNLQAMKLSIPTTSGFSLSKRESKLCNKNTSQDITPGRFRSRLSLSAFRKPEAAVRLTDADPSRSIHEFYDLYAPQSRVLGHGASSTVRLAIRRSDGAKVAVKAIAKHDILFSRRGRHRSRRKRMFEEWEIMKALEGNRHVVGMLDAFETDEQVQLVLEYCAGGELFDAIQRKKQKSENGSGYSEAQAAKIVAQLLSTLEKLHGKGIVHRDIKPENVLLLSEDEDETRVKLSDFGLARVLQSSPVAEQRQMGSTYDFSSDSSSSDDSSSEDPPCAMPTACRFRAFSRVGSDTYVAPEVMSGAGYDTAVDVYSLGVTLYILLCGYSPSSLEWKSRDEDCCPANEGPAIDFSGTQWGNVSDQAKDLVKKMMEPDPSLRFTAEEALKHEWFAQNCEYAGADRPKLGHCEYLNFGCDYFRSRMHDSQTRGRKRSLPDFANGGQKRKQCGMVNGDTASSAITQSVLAMPFAGSMAISMVDLYSRVSSIAADRLINGDDDEEVDIADRAESPFGTILPPLSV